MNRRGIRVYFAVRPSRQGKRHLAPTGVTRTQYNAWFVRASIRNNTGNTPVVGLVAPLQTRIIVNDHYIPRFNIRTIRNIELFSAIGAQEPSV